MWLTLEDTPILERALAQFLLSLRDGQPQVSEPLIADSAVIHALYAEPHLDLWEALRHCLDAFLLELRPNPVQWGKLQVPVSVLGLTLAFHNCLYPIIQHQIDSEENLAGSAKDFTAALIATLPPACEQDTALVYHAVLHGVEIILRQPETERSKLLHTLIELSPLTALKALDVHTPVVLNKLAAELVPGWHTIDQTQIKIWDKSEEWLEVVIALLSDAHIARWLRHCWLMMPETRQACRNVGLLLEMLRRRGEHREFILEFYEAYDYFYAETQVDEWLGQIRVWPILGTINKLLDLSGSSEAIIRVNRWGNEYFLKFRPLIEMIIAENGIPSDYAWLSLEFARALRPFLDYITENVQQRVSFGEVAFEEQRE